MARPRSQPCASSDDLLAALQPRDSVLSVRRCRELLGPGWARASDEVVADLRDSLVALADVVIAAARTEDSDEMDPVADWVDHIAAGDGDARADFDERAAIRELDGELDRRAAERGAIQDAVRARARRRERS